MVCMYLIRSNILIYFWYFHENKTIVQIHQSLLRQILSWWSDEVSLLVINHHLTHPFVYFLIFTFLRTALFPIYCYHKTVIKLISLTAFMCLSPHDTPQVHLLSAAFLTCIGTTGFFSRFQFKIKNRKCLLFGAFSWNVKDKHEIEDGQVTWDYLRVCWYFPRKKTKAFVPNRVLLFKWFIYSSFNMIEKR